MKLFNIENITRTNGPFMLVNNHAIGELETLSKRTSWFSQRDGGDSRTRRRICHKLKSGRLTTSSPMLIHIKTKSMLAMTRTIFMNCFMRVSREVELGAPSRVSSSDLSGAFFMI
jgi:hypothetical protein